MTKLKVFMGGGNGNDNNLMSTRTRRNDIEMGTIMKKSQSYTKAILSFNVIPIITLLLILTGKGITFLH